MMKYLEFSERMLVGLDKCMQNGGDLEHCAECKHWSDAEGCEFLKIDFTEIRKLHDLLTAAEIPHTLKPRFAGWHLVYPDSGERVCSAITHRISYGQYLGLIEIMGLLTTEELENDSVLGYLTGDDVFERIKAHWEGKK